MRYLKLLKEGADSTNLEKNVLYYIKGENTPYIYKAIPQVKVTITTTEANQNVCIGGVAVEDYYEDGTLTVANKDDETIWVTDGGETYGFAETKRDGEYSYYEATGGGETLIFKTVDVNNAQVGDTLACYGYDWMVGLPLGFSEVTIDGVALNLSEYEGYDSPHWYYDTYFYTFANVGTHELVYTLLDNEIKMSSFNALGRVINDDNNWEALDTIVEIGNCVTTIKDYAFCYTTLTSITIPSSVTSIGESALDDDGSNILQSITFEHTVCPFTTEEECNYFFNKIFTWNENLTIYHICNNSWNTFDSVYEQICEDEGQTICQIECLPCYRAEEQSDGTYKFYSTESGEELENRLVESTETMFLYENGQVNAYTKMYYEVKCGDEWVETDNYTKGNLFKENVYTYKHTITLSQDSNLLMLINTYLADSVWLSDITKYTIFVNGVQVELTGKGYSTGESWIVTEGTFQANTPYEVTYIHNEDYTTMTDDYSFLPLYMTWNQSYSNASIGQDVTRIAKNAFDFSSNETNLFPITLPNTVEYIANCAFYNCEITFDGTYDELEAKCEDLWNDNHTKNTIHFSDGTTATNMSFCNPPT